MARYLRSNTKLILPDCNVKKFSRKISRTIRKSPDQFETQQNNSSKKNITLEVSNISTDRSNIYRSETQRYQICTDSRPAHKLILEKPKYEQEKFVNDVTYLQPAYTPIFIDKTN